MELRDDIKNTEKYLDSAAHTEDCSDQDNSSDEEAQKRATSALQQKRSTRKKVTAEEDLPEPKSRRQPKPTGNGAPPRKRQSRVSDSNKPSLVKKYESKWESELSKSKPQVDPPKRPRGRPRLSEQKKKVEEDNTHGVDKDALEEMFRFYKKAIDEANKKMPIMRFETTLIYDPERDIFI